MWKWIRNLLFLFDAETVHRFTVRLIRLAMGVDHGRPITWVSGYHSAPQKLLNSAKIPLVFGKSFRSRLGLAAGFDKDAEIVDALSLFGFGFAEIGTVTPRPQPGNERPRLFRDSSTMSVFNRMGFNGQGARAVRKNLDECLHGVPVGFRVGVNLGKNKDTPLEDAHQDYRTAASYFLDVADYLVINISSPNTPGLRSLQGGMQLESHLRPIIEGVSNLIAGQNRPIPLLLKLAPDVSEQNLTEILSQAPDWGVQGWVLTNTLPGSFERPGNQSLEGGWSGAPLQNLSKKRLIEARKQTSLPIISVGGILSVHDAQERVRLGADLVQIYSGWIFEGPRFPKLISDVL